MGLPLGSDGSGKRGDLGAAPPSPPSPPRPRFCRRHLAPGPAGSGRSPPGYIRSAPRIPRHGRRARSGGSRGSGGSRKGDFWGRGGRWRNASREGTSSEPAYPEHPPRSSVPSGRAAPLTWRLLSLHAGSPRDGTGQGGSARRCGAPAPCAPPV